jgi:hypothetical protein
VPFHEPLDVVKTCPWLGVPEAAGSAVLTGEAAATAAVCVDCALALPAAFVAVTCERIVVPTSALVTV